MANVGRVGVDAAGGAVIGNLAPTVRVNGAAVAVVGAAVASHGTNAHANATMVGHSATVRAQGIFICRAGDAASCGHVLGAGSASVRSS